MNHVPQQNHNTLHSAAAKNESYNLFTAIEIKIDFQQYKAKHSMVYNKSVKNFIKRTLLVRISHLNRTK